MKKYKIIALSIIVLASSVFIGIVHAENITNGSLDMETHKITNVTHIDDLAGITSVDVANRFLYDNNVIGVPSLDWQNRKLYDNALVEKLDWQNNWIPQIVSHGNFNAINHAVTVATTVAGATDTDFTTNLFVGIISVNATTIRSEVAYTDKNGATQTQIIYPNVVPAIVGGVLTTTGQFSYPSITVRAKAGTGITLRVVIIAAGVSISYDANGSLVQDNP